VLLLEFGLKLVILSLIIVIQTLKSIAIDEPTMSMLFTLMTLLSLVKKVRFVTSRHIRDRLTKELEKFSHENG
jgi:predicted membrane GTPase involved in stress response